MNIRQYAVIDSRTDALYDGPFFSMVGASDAASRANQLAREQGKPARFFMIEIPQPSSSLPGHEKPGHWFDTNTNGFSEEK